MTTSIPPSRGRSGVLWRRVCASVRSGAPRTLRGCSCTVRFLCYCDRDLMSSTIPLVVPIRFSGGGLTMQSTTNRIGAESVFVRSLISPKEGSRVMLSLSLPGSARPLDATGTVAAPGIEAAKDRGFWVRFDQLSEEARSFLEVVLRSKGVTSPPRQGQRAAAPRADGGRAYARVPARVRVG